MVTVEPLGRRERKKAATRQALADAAWELFIARGFDGVSVKEVADRADVSTTTLFKHFPSKEALVFDRSDDFEAELIATIHGRPAGQHLLDALRIHATQAWVPIAEDPRLSQLGALIEATPSLRRYSEQIWLRHTDALASAIAEDLGRLSDDLDAATLARFVLDIPALIRTRTNPRQAVQHVFDLLARGWEATTSENGKPSSR